MLHPDYLMNWAGRRNGEKEKKYRQRGKINILRATPSDRNHSGRYWSSWLLFGVIVIAALHPAWDPQWSHTKQGPLLHSTSVSPCHWVVCVLGMPNSEHVFGVYYWQIWAARWFESTIPVHISCISDKIRKGQQGMWIGCGRSEEEMLLGQGELGWASHCITHADVSLMQPLKHTISGKITRDYIYEK